VGDAIGLMMTVPLALWLRDPGARQHLRLARRDRLVWSAACVLAIGAGIWLNYRTNTYFYVLPSVVMAALVFRRAGAALAGTAGATGTLLAVTIASGTASDRFLQGQIFVLVVLAIVYLLAVVLEERDLTMELRQAEAQTIAAAEAMREAEAQRRQALEAARAGVWQLRPGSPDVFRDPGWRELYGFGPDEDVTKEAWQARVHPEDLPRIEANLREALAMEKGEWVQEFRIRHPSLGERWLHDRVQVRQDGAGQSVSVHGLTLDISERKAAEEQIRLLMREVNHRSKNLLAVVQAVARMTAVGANPEAFARAFAERIAGLAASHDLLVKNAWQRVDLGELVRSQLAPFGGLVGTRVVLSGPHLALVPAAAQAIGMALHELATNASKYGALSNREGRVHVTWCIADGEEGPRLRLHWSEQGGPVVEPPRRNGFGRMVLVDMAEQSLFGRVRLDHASDGIVWDVEAPVERVLEGGAAGLPPSLLPKATTAAGKAARILRGTTRDAPGPVAAARA
jgi:PAS domain S-box-containing protein